MSIPTVVPNAPILDSLLSTARQAQTRPAALFDKSFIHLDVKESTLFIFSGDWHLGALGTDYVTFEDDINNIYAAKSYFDDKVQVIAMGDYIDGYLSQGTPANPNQILSPKEQRQAAQEALRLIKPAIIIEGDHDLWHSKQEIQYDWLYEFAQDNSFNYAQWGTEINIKALKKDRMLKWLVRHRAKGTKGADTLKPQKNVFNTLGPADLVALGHFHSYPGCFKVDPVRRHEGQYIAVQSGTYKLHDEYGKKLGYTQADYGVPGVIVHPDGRMVSFDNYRDGLELLI